MEGTKRDQDVREGPWKALQEALERSPDRFVVQRSNVVPGAFWSVSRKWCTNFQVALYDNELNGHQYSIQLSSDVLIFISSYGHNCNSEYLYSSVQILPIITYLLFVCLFTHEESSLTCKSYLLFSFSTGYPRGTSH